MEWHQYFRSISEYWIVLIYDTGRGVQADQKDGTAKIDLLFSQHQAPPSWGFLFVRVRVDLDMMQSITPTGEFSCWAST